MDTGFGSWLFVMSVGSSALGGLLGVQKYFERR